MPSALRSRRHRPEVARRPMTYMRPCNGTVKSWKMRYCGCSAWSHAVSHASAQQRQNNACKPCCPSILIIARQQAGAPSRCRGRWGKSAKGHVRSLLCWADTGAGIAGLYGGDLYCAQMSVHIRALANFLHELSVVAIEQPIVPFLRSSSQVSPPVLSLSCSSAG